jgi:hypothetical protein
MAIMIAIAGAWGREEDGFRIAAFSASLTLLSVPN